MKSRSEEIFWMVLSVNTGNMIWDGDDIHQWDDVTESDCEDIIVWGFLDNESEPVIDWSGEEFYAWLHQT